MTTVTEGAKGAHAIRRPRRVDTVTALRHEVATWRARGESTALVPTMGSLHAGHLALAEEALGRCDRVVVSIFVNPTQFCPGDDYERYPRAEVSDVAKIESRGVDLVFTPSVDEMYRPGFATTVSVEGASSNLCGRFRPAHFRGVATVVTKLLLQCQPEVAVFGEKDYQQLHVIKTLARDLDIPVEIVGVPTVREADGLAMSSRNAYLPPADRQVAGRFAAVLVAVSARLKDGEPISGVLAWGRRELSVAGVTALEYLELRDAETLLPVATLDTATRLLAAVRIGTTRLIDNFPVPPAG